VRISKGSNEASAELADKTQSMADNHGKIVWALVSVREDIESDESVVIQE
jgi:hypothetical protein